MNAILTIGGGKRGPRGTGPIDREIIRLTGKRRPRLLYLPTANGDQHDFWERIQKYFTALGCRTDVLFLIKEKPGKAEIKRKILAADIVYVGGGNTVRLMRWWRRLGVDQILKTAYRQGVVLSGVSAGSICWYDSGCYYNKKKRRYVTVKGLGLIPGCHSPHYKRRTLNRPQGKHLKTMIRKRGALVIGIEDNCAIEFIDGKHYRVIAAKRGGAAFRIYQKGKLIVSEKLVNRKNFSPISDLYRRSKP